MNIKQHLTRAFGLQLVCLRDIMSLFYLFRAIIKDIIGYLLSYHLD
jgi:hypothetical protein